jgi:tetratricopeptide (TPR) repeat protein
MMLHLTSIKQATLVACLVTGASVYAQGQECNPTVMIERVLENDMANALIEAKRCVSEMKAVEARASPAVGLSTGNLMQVTLLGYYQCAQAQLEAAAGDIRNAKIHVADAEATGDKWSNFYRGPLFLNWDGLLNVTRGFVLEKSGDLPGAKQLYATAPDWGDIRLAELALNENRDDDALLIARKMQTSWPDGPHAWIVLGALAEKRRDTDSAITDYQQALKRMENIGHQFFPIHYFSSVRAREGLARLGSPLR